jgi:hypothetical protein
MDGIAAIDAPEEPSDRSVGRRGGGRFGVDVACLIR